MGNSENALFQRLNSCLLFVKICITLQEWEHITERFENATHYTEKALFKVLVNDIVPFVTHELRVCFI